MGGYNFSFYPGRTDIPLLDVYCDDIASSVSGWTGTCQVRRARESAAADPALERAATLARVAWAALDEDVQESYLAALVAVDADAVAPSFVWQVTVTVDHADTVALTDVYLYGVELDGTSNVPVLAGTVNFTRDAVF